MGIYDLNMKILIVHILDWKLIFLLISFFIKEICKFEKWILNLIQTLAVLIFEGLFYW